MNKEYRNKISKFSVVKHSTFEGGNAVSKFSKIYSSYVGFASYIASYSKLFNCKIGKFCSIGQYTQIVFGEHPTSKFVSTYPAFYSVTPSTNISFVENNRFEEYSYIDNEKKYFVEIGNDVWIGYGALILSGVHIGDGSIVAAGAVVVNDVPPYSIVGGVPAKVIKYRFDESDINFLQELKWWNRDLSWIHEYADYFDDIKRLRAVLRGE